MDNFDTNDPNQSNESGESIQPEEIELSHSDKMIGVFSEPATTFEKIAKFPLKTVDWLLPIIILLFLVIVTQIIVTSNSEIYYQIKEKQIARVQETFDEMVKKGQMTQDQADQQMNNVRDRFAKGRGITAYIFQSVSILIFGFIIFFIISGVFFLFSRFVFKGEGSYVSAMIASGLPAYISMIQVILAAILSLIMGRLLQDVSLASLMDVDKSTFTGFILGKLDVISIWAYAITSIGLAKLFGSKSTTKYYILVFGLWILWGLLIFFLGQAVPFLKFLAG